MWGKLTYNYLECLSTICLPTNRHQLNIQSVLCNQCLKDWPAKFIMFCVISPQEGKMQVWRRNQQLMASDARSQISPVCYITWKPSRYVSFFDTSSDDAFLAGHGCALFQAALATKSTIILNMWPENRWLLWPSKQINQPVMNCTFGSALTHHVRDVLPKIVPQSQYVWPRTFCFIYSVRSTQLLTKLQHWFYKLWPSNPHWIEAGGWKLAH